MPLILKNSFGEDVTETVLKSESPVVFISFYDGDGITHDDLGKLKNLGDSLNYGRHRADVYVLSAMTEEETLARLKPIADAVENEAISDVFSSSYTEKSLPFSLVYSDYKSVITFNRSNGGATYVNRGIIVKKWSAAKYSNRKIISDITKNPYLLTQGSEGRSRLFLIVSLAIIIGMVLIIRLIFKALYKTVKGTVDVLEDMGE